MLCNRISLPVLSLCTLIGSAHANVVVNGGFETNLNADTAYNLSNSDFTASMLGATAFGGADEVDIIHRDNSNFGLPAVEGDWHTALHSSEFNGEDDAISMSLTAPQFAGQQYQVDLFAQLVTHFDPGTGMLEIGISNDSDSFGELVQSFNISSPDVWLEYTASFTANSNFQFLTLRTARQGAEGAWVHLDDVSLTTIPSPSALCLIGIGALMSTKRKR